MLKKPSRLSGFTFIELLIVIVIIGVLAALLLPRYWNVARQARIATLDGVVGTMRSAVGIAKTQALAQGIRPTGANPGGSQQAMNVIQMEGFSAEVDWRNLCPESEAESGDAVNFLEYLYLMDNPAGALGDLLTQHNNRYTWVGYDIPGSGNGPGCYVRYDSFGSPACTIELFIDSC